MPYQYHRLSQHESARNLPQERAGGVYCDGGHDDNGAGLCHGAQLSRSQVVVIRSKIVVYVAASILVPLVCGFALMCGGWTHDTGSKGWTHDTGPESAMVSQDHAAQQRGLRTPDQLVTCLENVRKVHTQQFADLLTPEVRAAPLLLIDPAHHPNVGDNMLAWGEIAWALRNGWSPRNILQCRVHQASVYLPPCGDFANFTEAKLALWHAGGNWGDLYSELHRKRLRSFKVLLSRGFTVVSMPQTLHFKSAKAARKQSSILKRNLAATLRGGFEAVQKHLILTWRQRDSYEAARVLYPYLQNRLVPDIALQIGPQEVSAEPHKASAEDILASSMLRAFGDLAQAMPSVDLLLLLRDDSESVRGMERTREALQNTLDMIPGDKGKGVTFRIVDWNDLDDVSKGWSKPAYSFDGGTISVPRRAQTSPTSATDILDVPFNYTARIRHAVHLLSTGRVVVTDRLHCSLLALLMRKPHTFFDQISGKLTRTREVALGSSEKCDGIEAVVPFSAGESLTAALSHAVHILKNVLEK